MTDDFTAAFAALTSIESGEWDRFLLRLRTAIEQRLQTEGYRDHIIAGSTPTPENTAGLTTAYRGDREA